MRLWTAMTAFVLTAAVVTAPAYAAGAPKPSKNPQPMVRLPLDALGFPGFSKNFIEAGASMLTAHFVDDDHVLLTYSLRGLVERTAEDAPDDEPRAVAALLVEVKTGKVLARARWHLHDHAQYLWPLGDGRFVLRVHNALRAIAPLQNLDSGNAFREMPLVHVSGKLDLLQVSTEGDLLTVESSAPPAKQETRGVISFSDSAGGPPPVLEQITFLRIIGTGSEESPVRAVLAGTTHTRSAGPIPVNGRGYLYASLQGRTGNWDVQFEGFGGDAVKLAPVMSSCAPQFRFVGLGQFVAVTCRGMEDRLMLSSFDFVPRETWEEPFSGPLTNAFFATSPRGGRFAFSREISQTALMPGVMATTGSTPAPQDVTTSQEIRVYQAESGDLLLKVPGTPSLRAGQDFDLSPDGMSALVLHGGAIEIYHLPELKKEDREDLAEVKAHEPAVVTADRLEVRRVMSHAAVAEETPTENAVAAPGAATAPAEANTIVNGDAPPAARRSAPSLLAPGESAEDASKAPK